MADGYVPGTPFFSNPKVAPSGAPLIAPFNTQFLGLLPAIDGSGTLFFVSNGGLNIGPTG